MGLGLGFGGAREGEEERCELLHDLGCADARPDHVAIAVQTVTIRGSRHIICLFGIIANPHLPRRPCRDSSKPNTDLGISPIAGLAARFVRAVCARIKEPQAIGNTVGIHAGGETFSSSPIGSPTVDASAFEIFGGGEKVSDSHLAWRGAFSPGRARYGEGLLTGHHLWLKGRFVLGRARLQLWDGVGERRSGRRRARRGSVGFNRKLVRG